MMEIWMTMTLFSHKYQFKGQKMMKESELAVTLSRWNCWIQEEQYVSTKPVKLTISFLDTLLQYTSRKGASGTKYISVYIRVMRLCCNVNFSIQPSRELRKNSS